MSRRSGCLVCGAPLEYKDEAVKVRCVFCGREFETHAICVNGHYVCDECHAEKGIEAVMRVCGSTESRDPVRIAQEIMADPFVYMHGPEHHVLVGSALLAAYINSGGEADLQKGLAEMKERGSQYPGGACGCWGCCGAAVSAGMFVSIVTQADPLSGMSWRLSNEMTSRALAKIAALGGPRCCKRDSFTAILEAAAFCREKLGVEMEVPEKVLCTFSGENKECLGRNCPYNRANAK